MTRRQTYSVSNNNCPANPAHGPLIPLKDGLQHCPHADHCGRAASHPLGAAPSTRATFTEAEAENGSVAGAAAA